MQSGSGPFSGSWIYLVIAIMWAVVLVPMWLKRHDEAQESRSADRFARAMGTLRRGSSADGAAPQREVLMPTRPRRHRESQIVVTGPRASQSPAAIAAARRRRTLFGLLGLLTLTLLLGAVGVVPLLVSVVPLLMVAGFLVVARRQVTLAAEARRRRDRRTALADAAREADARYATGRSAPRRGGRAVDPAPAPEAAPERVVAEATGTDAWHAVPTTLPTYVTAPRATKMPRVIDLTHPGAWTGAAMVEQARSSLVAEPVADGEMRVETFDISIPRDVEPQPSQYRAESYAERYIEDDELFETLDSQDDLDSLLEDPRTGVDLPAWRRAANG